MSDCPVRREGAQTQSHWFGKGEEWQMRLQGQLGTEVLELGQLFFFFFSTGSTRYQSLRT